MCVRLVDVDIEIVGQKRHLVGVKSSSSDSDSSSCSEEDDSEVSLLMLIICDSKTE